MSAIAEAYVKIRPVFTGFRASVAGETGAAAERAGATAGRRFSEGFKSAAKVVGIGAGFFAATEIAAGIRESVKSAAEQEGATAVLIKTIQNAGASTRLYGEEIDRLIEKQGLQRGFTDDELIPAFGRLVSGVKDTEKAYKLLDLAEGVARARNTSVAAAALALAKAQQGSVTSLQRLGIILPEHIKKLGAVERGTAAIAEVQRRFAGTADAFANSGAGALAKYDAAMNKIKETIGVALLPEVEAVAEALSKFLQDDENVARIQKDVADVTQVVAGAFKAVAVSVKVVSTVLKPLIGLVGGFEKAAELAFGALIAKKIYGVVRAMYALGTAQTVAAAAAATQARANATATGTIIAEGAAAAATTPKLYAFSKGMLGLQGAAVLAGYALGTVAIKALGLEGPLKSAGGYAEKLAEKLGLVKGATAKGALNATFGPDIQKQLADAFKKIPANAPKQIRDALVEKLVGKGYTYNDAKIFANRPAPKGPQIGGTPFAEIAGAPRPTNLDYQIKVQQALQTKATADERALYEGRRSYLDRRIARLQKDTDLSAAEKKVLLKLLEDRNAVEDSIKKIDDDAAQAAKAKAEKAKQARDAAKAAAREALQAYKDSLGAQEILLQLEQQKALLSAQTSKQEAQLGKKLIAFYQRESNDAKLTKEERARYESQAIAARQSILQTTLSDREAELQLKKHQAELTGKRLKDDKAASRKLIAFYTRESKDAALSLSQRLQYASAAVDEKLALKGLKKTKPDKQTSTAAEFFQEAVSNFRQYGSNIAGRGGILSGQDARAAFAYRALRQSPQSIAQQVAADQAARDGVQLTESQKQTSLLQGILNAVGGKPSKVTQNAKPTDHAIVKARVGVGAGTGM